MAPALPSDYVDRPTLVAAAKATLLARSTQPSSIVTLRGAGGTGKTTLAKALAGSDDVVDAFYDGVLWVTLGTQPKMVEIIADLCCALGTDVHFSGIDSATGYLRSILENRRCLVVVDDLWRMSDLQPFIDLGPSITTMITTRVAEVARTSSEDARIPIESMTELEAARLLLTAIPGEHARRVKTHVARSWEGAWGDGRCCSVWRPGSCERSSSMENVSSRH